MNSWKALIVGVKLDFWFESSAMSRVGNINDFISAMRSKGNSMKFFADDWKYFLKLVNIMIRKGFSGRMKEVSRILNQKTYPQTNSASDSVIVAEKLDFKEPQVRFL